MQETIDIVRQRGGKVVGVGVMLDRSGGQRSDYGCPFFSLVQMEVDTFPEDQIPPDLANVPAIKPGS